MTWAHLARIAWVQGLPAASLLRVAFQPLPGGGSQSSQQFGHMSPVQETRAAFQEIGARVGAAHLSSTATAFGHLR